MGYDTQFKGVLKFKPGLSSSQLGDLTKILGEDCRDHPEYNTEDLSYINLRIADDFSGLEWDGSEKTYNMDGLVNVIIRQMRKKYPEFGLVGKLLAQGEEISDRWELIIDDLGFAKVHSLSLKGTIIECPHCEQSFEYMDS